MHALHPRFILSALLYCLVQVEEQKAKAKVLCLHAKDLTLRKQAEECTDDASKRQQTQVTTPLHAGIHCTRFPRTSL